MGGKKKSASKRKSPAKPAKPAVHSVAPVEPVNTRSKAKSSSADLPVTASQRSDRSPARQPITAGPISDSSIFAIQQALEERFDERMARMETDFRASIASMITSATPAVVSTIPAGAAAMPPPTHAAPKSSTRVSSRATSAASSRSDSSRSSKSARSSSSGSSSRSRSRSSRRHHRRHRHSRSRSRPKHGKYTSARYLKENQKLATYERLVLVNIKMAIALLKREKDISGVLSHMLMIADKADKNVFEPEALISYDESVKEMAKESGIKAFAKIDPSLIVKHLSYDGTKNAKSEKAAVSRKFKPAAGARRAPAGSYCIKHNFEPSGCSRGKDCSYRHICSACYGSGHVTIVQILRSRNEGWRALLGRTLPVATSGMRTWHLRLLANASQFESASRDLASRDLPSAIFVPSSKHQLTDLPAADSTPIGESDMGDCLLFDTPSFDDVPSIPIYTSCVAGSCSCIHLIGDYQCQLKPCRAAQFVFGPSPSKRLVTLRDFSFGWSW